MSGNGLVVGADVGGTFTDLVLVGRDGSLALRKVVTTPDDQSEAVADGLSAELEETTVLAHGTTTATNAILERAVGRTVLITTSGFRDILAIGRQDRPSLYDLTVVRPPPLVDRADVVTVKERLAADGSALRPLTEAEVGRVVEEVAARSPESVAISLLFSYADPSHEERLAAALDGLGLLVTRSSRLLPEFREYERASTCVINAAVAPVMTRYLSRLRDRLPPATVLRLMTSSGGTATAAELVDAPVHSLLSGPAAGVVAAAQVAERAGFSHAAAFDMGGTSTDVCLITDGRPQIVNQSAIDGLPFRTPTVAIHTVGAGGGSIAWVDEGGALRVGPRSAGARPGPAAYGRGGEEPTVTDAHCVLGHLAAGSALGSDQLSLDIAAARRALDSLPSGAGGADGVLEVVRAAMARALRKVTTEQGVDPGDLALVAYGGAGPLHATALARRVGCSTVIIPAWPGVLSSLGLLLAGPRVEVSETVLGRDGLPAIWSRLEEAARSAIAGHGGSGEVRVQRVADCRYRGQSHELRLALDGPARLRDRFHTAHREAYGYHLPHEEVEVVTLRVMAESAPSLDSLPEWSAGDRGRPTSRRVVMEGETVDAQVLERSALAVGQRLVGPAVIEQMDSTTLLGPGEEAEIDEGGSLVVRLRG